MSQYQIALVVGSLRRESFKRKLATAVTKLAPSVPGSWTRIFSMTGERTKI